MVRGGNPSFNIPSVQSNGTWYLWFVVYYTAMGYCVITQKSVRQLSAETGLITRTEANSRTEVN